jgi:CRP/FNR family transcriptional regulator
MARILETLERHPLFAGILRGDLEPVVLASRLRTPAKGDRLFGVGEPADAFYIVESGAIKLWNVAPGGREVLVEVMRPAESFGLMPVMDGGAYPVTATALVRSAVVRVPRDAYRRLLDRRPELYSRATCEIADRMRRLRRRLEEATVLGVTGRVACHLERLAEQGGVGLRRGVVVDLGATREVVAASIGTVREVFSRTIRAMEKDRLVAIRGRRVEIQDPDRLHALGRV